MIVSREHISYGLIWIAQNAEIPGTEFIVQSLSFQQFFFDNAGNYTSSVGSVAAQKFFVEFLLNAVDFVSKCVFRKQKIIPDNFFKKSFSCGFLIFFFIFCGFNGFLFQSTSLQGCLYVLCGIASSF